VIIPGGRSKSRQIRSLFVFTGGVETTETDHQVPQSGVVFRSVLGASGGPIFSEGNISHVMERVLDRPVASAESLELSGVHFGGRTAAEDKFGLFGNADGLEMMSGADNHGRLGRMGKPRALWSDFERIDLPGIMPTVALVQTDVRRGKKRRSRP
jgi:hypothetical protein